MAISYFANEVLPTGAILCTGNNSEPMGYIKCNGAAISRSTYAGLFSFVGTTYGSGDGSTTFNVPDARGVFLRGLDESRGLDASRALGTYQDDDVASHSHSAAVASGQDIQPANTSTTAYGTPSGASSTGSAGSAETRPKNVALVYWIKF